MDEITERVLELVRNDFKLYSSNVSDESWPDVFNELERQKLLLTMAQKGRHLLPDGLRNELDNRLIFYTSRTSLYLETLENLQQIADQEDLQFTLIKGLPLSYTLYSTPFGRQFNDLDILIDPTDIPKADYVIRSLGFVQPIGHRVTAINLGDQKLSPYAFIRRRGEIQLSPYYAVVDGISLKVEIHFGLRCDVENVLQRVVLWKTEELNLGKTVVNMPNGVAQFLYLIINAYENSESVFSNQSNAKRGYRDFVDVHFFLKEYKESLCQRELDELIKALSLKPIIDVVGASYLDLYPADRAIWEALFGVLETRSIWKDSLSDCLRSTKKRAMSPSSAVLYAKGEPRINICFNKRVTVLDIMPGNRDGRAGGEVAFLVEDSNDRFEGKSLCVYIDAELRKDLVYQFSLCCNAHGPKFSRYEINLFQNDGRWEAKAGWHNKICFGADMEKNRRYLRITSSRTGNTYMVKIRLPKMDTTKIDILPCIFRRSKTGYPSILAFESTPTVFSLIADQMSD